MEDQVGPLVGGKTPGKPDGEDRLVQERAPGNKVWSVIPFFCPLHPFSFADPVDELVLELKVQIPEILVRDLINKLPDCFIIMLLLPVGGNIIKMGVQEILDPGVHPCREVDTVGDCIDRDLVFGKIRPEPPPHLPGHLVVFFRNPVAVA